VKFLWQSKKIMGMRAKGEETKKGKKSRENMKN
jgi:hypothetical protein